MHHSEVPLPDIIFHREVTDVHCSRLLGQNFSAFLAHQNAAFVILKNIALYWDPLALHKIWTHKTFDKKSTTATNLAIVLLRVFSFCFILLEAMPPPLGCIMSTPPLCDLKSGWHAKYESMCHQARLRLSYLSVK